MARDARGRLGGDQRMVGEGLHDQGLGRGIRAWGKLAAHTGIPKEITTNKASRNPIQNPKRATFSAARLSESRART